MKHCHKSELHTKAVICRYKFVFWSGRVGFTEIFLSPLSFTFSAHVHNHPCQETSFIAIQYFRIRFPGISILGWINKGYRVVDSKSDWLHPLHPLNNRLMCRHIPFPLVSCLSIYLETSYPSASFIWMLIIS